VFGFLTIVLMIVEVVCCLLLLGVILIQKTKGQGMGMAFGSAMGETLFGARAGNVLTRSTVILGIVFLVNTTLLAMLGSRRIAVSSSVTDALDPEPAPMAAPAGMPMQPGPAAETFDVGDLPAVPATDLPEAPPTAPTAQPVAPVTAPLPDSAAEPLPQPPPAAPAAE
jgi:preprotein translocase subunit SecG